MGKRKIIMTIKYDGEYTAELHFLGDGFDVDFGESLPTRKGLVARVKEFADCLDRDLLENHSGDWQGPGGEE